MPEPVDPSRTAPAAQNLDSSAASDRDETSAASSSGVTTGPRFGSPLATGEVGTLGPYRVLKELGKGGMGAVYLALDTRLDRKLALKIMLPEFAADRDAKERFLREARSAAKISHDNVVTVFEADERDGVPYIAMQFLQGYPLDEYLKTKGAPALPHVIRIARETALGLSAAHTLGLVHRDIKPANLWLEAPTGRVKVLDFGLAKPIGGDTELTKSGAVVGTPAYMSPEQARGAKVDHRTDIFSLGAVLYRLCTGKTPFAGPNVMAVLTALAVDEPAPVRALNPNIPEPLAQLIHQLLAKKPEDRPQTAAEVAKRLRAILDQLVSPGAAAPLPAPSPSTPDLSTSMPVVVNPVPVLPPAVSPMHVTAKPESAFENLDASDEDTETVAEPPKARPKPEKKPPAKGKGGKGALLAAGLAVLLAVGAFGMVMALKGGKKPDDTAKNADPPPADTNKEKDKPKDKEKEKPPAPKANELPPLPAFEWKPVAAGASPFDKLDPKEIPADERFDWQPKELVAVVGTHARRIWGGAWSVAMSADGKLAAVYSPLDAPAASLTVWDTETRQLKWALAPRGGNAHHHSFSFTPDGKRLGFFTHGWLTLYDLTGPKPTATEHNLNDKPDGKTAFTWRWIGFCEGGRTLAAWGWRDIGLFDLTGEKPRFSEAKAFAQDRQLLLLDDTITTAMPVPGRKLHQTTIKGAKFGDEKELPLKLAENQDVRGWSPDGKRVVLWSGDHAQIWDLSQNPPKQIGKAVGDGVGRQEGYALSADGRWLVSKYTHTALYRLGGAEAKLVDWLDRTDSDVHGGVALSADGNRAVVSTTPGFLRFWDLSGEKPKELPAPFDMATAVRAPSAGFGERSLAPSGGLVTLRGYEHGCRIWNLTGTKPVPDPGWVNFGPATRPVGRGRWLSGNHGIAIRFHEVGEKEWRAEETGPGTAHTSPDGTLLVRQFPVPGSEALQLEGYDISGPKAVLKWALDPMEHPIVGMQHISGGNRWLGYLSRKVKDGPLAFAVWQLGGAKPEFYTQLPVTCDPRDYRTAFSPDGRLLCHNPDGRGLVFADLTGRTPREITRLDGNNAPGFGVMQVYAMAFNPDGKTVALGVAGSLCGVAVVEVPSGKVLWKWAAENCPHVLEFAHDGRHLFVHNANSTLYVLRLNDLGAGAAVGAADADRKAAEWALSVGGKVTVKDTVGEKEVSAAKELPKGTWTLTQVFLAFSTTKDVELDHLNGCSGLESLNLHQAKAITDAGLGRLKGLVGLTRLDIAGTQVTDAGVEHIKGMTKLTTLSIHDTQVTDAAMAHVARFGELNRLFIRNTAVSDDALESLQKLGKLEVLSLENTKVTAAGVEKLAKALPKCQIIWAGGTVEPKK